MEAILKAQRRGSWSAQQFAFATRGVAPHTSARMMHANACRIGSVPYLNAVPLTWGLEREIVLAPPSLLASRLRAGDLDAALVSVTEALLHPGYDLVDGFGIVSHGPVRSVVLAHRLPLEEIGVVHLDTASCTSVNLLRVLFASRGLSPRYENLDDYSRAAEFDAVLLIGDPALTFRCRGTDHDIWDLGDAWREWTGLPFVYAAWAVRRDADVAGLARLLRSAGEAGLEALPHIIESESRFDTDLRKAYLGGNIQYRVGAAERAGLQCFGDSLRTTHGTEVQPIRWV